MRPRTPAKQSIGTVRAVVVMACLFATSANLGHGQSAAPVAAHDTASVLPSATSAIPTPPPAAGAVPGLDDRIVIKNVKINDQPVSIAFDTGTDAFMLFSPAAKRLGLKITEPPSGEKPEPGKVALGETNSVNVQLEGNTVATTLPVIDLPEGLPADFDGLCGWGAVKGNLIILRAGSHDLMFLPDEALAPLLGLAAAGDGFDLGLAPGHKAEEPADAFQQLRIRKDSDILVLDFPSLTGLPGGILIDSGDQGGVLLAPAKWREWRAAHPTAPITMDAYYTPAAGIVVREMAWAKELTVGTLTLTNVTVQEAELSAMPDIAGYAATLGLAALDRQDVIIDGENGVVYFARQTAPVKSIQHNRLGAVFAPIDMQHDDLVAHVAVGSPAEMAGIRNGDLLLKIDAKDETKWRTDHSMQSGVQFGEPAGTTINLTLKRGEKEFTARVTLRDILGPGLDPTAKPSPVSPQPGK